MPSAKTSGISMINPGVAAPMSTMVRGIGRKSDQRALVENRHDNGDVRRMARSVIGMIVNDEIAVMPFAVLQRVANAREIAGQRADMQRRRFRLAERIELGVEQSGAKILRFADDGGERHAVEYMPISSAIVCKAPLITCSVMGSIASRAMLIAFSRARWTWRLPNSATSANSRAAIVSSNCAGSGSPGRRSDARP